MEDSEHIRSSAEEDAEIEAAVLQQILALHPTMITVNELLRELGGGADEPTKLDAIERAVRDLVATGLLHRSGDFVVPTRAALRFEQLLDR
jgi:hypothetical protein